VKDRPYIYTGPLTGATLADGREVLLVPGSRCELPPHDPYIAGLVAQNRLTPITIKRSKGA